MKQANYFKTVSPEETIEVARQFSESLRPGDLLCLHGDLGSGKTTFVKGLAKGMGLAPEAVKSPTFVIMHVYEGRLPLYHFDFYRFESAQEIEGLGMDDFFLSPDAVSCLEWPEKVASALPHERYDIRIELLGPSERSITIEVPGKQ